jgi:hypothetical protein
VGAERTDCEQVGAAPYQNHRLAVCMAEQRHAVCDRRKLDPGDEIRSGQFFGFVAHVLLPRRLAALGLGRA